MTSPIQSPVMKNIEKEKPSPIISDSGHKPSLPPRSAKPPVVAPKSRKSLEKLGENMPQIEFDSFMELLPFMTPMELEDYVKNRTAIYMLTCKQLELAIQSLPQREQKVMLAQLMASR